MHTPRLRDRLQTEFATRRLACQTALDLTPSHDGDRMGNPVTQFQILSASPDETARFYASLFGWTVNPGNPLGYRQIDTGSPAGIQGGIWPAPPQAPAFVQLFIEVHDLGAAIRDAERLGAKAIIPPATLPDGNQMTVMLDPQGMSFAMWRKPVAK